MSFGTSCSMVAPWRPNVGATREYLQAAFVHFLKVVEGIDPRDGGLSITLWTTLSSAPPPDAGNCHHTRHEKHRVNRFRDRDRRRKREKIECRVRSIQAERILLDDNSMNACASEANHTEINCLACRDADQVIVHIQRTQTKRIKVTTTVAKSRTNGPVDDARHCGVSRTYERCLDRRSKGCSLNIGP